MTITLSQFYYFQYNSLFKDNLLTSVINFEHLRTNVLEMLIKKHNINIFNVQQKVYKLICLTDNRDI